MTDQDLSALASLAPCTHDWEDGTGKRKICVDCLDAAVPKLVAELREAQTTAIELRKMLTPEVEAAAKLIAANADKHPDGCCHKCSAGLAALGEAQKERDEARAAILPYADAWAALDAIMVEHGMNKKAQPAEAQAWLRERFDDLEAAASTLSDAYPWLDDHGCRCGDGRKTVCPGCRAEAVLSRVGIRAALARARESK